MKLIGGLFGKKKADESSPSPSKPVEVLQDSMSGDDSWQQPPPQIARGPSPTLPQPSTTGFTPPTPAANPSSRSMLRGTSFSERTPLRTLSRLPSTRSRRMGGLTQLELGLTPPPAATPNYRPHPPPFAPSESVKVAVRVRPLVQMEHKEGCVSGLAADQRNAMIIVGEGQASRAFKFDSVFSPASNQSDVFDACVREVVNGTLSGYNGTVLAYGQTGSGKTHTMGTGAIEADLIRAADPDTDPDPTPLPAATPTTPATGFGSHFGGQTPTPGTARGLASVRSFGSHPLHMDNSDDDENENEAEDGYGDPSPLPSRFGARRDRAERAPSMPPPPPPPFEFPTDVGMLPRVARLLYEYLFELKKHHNAMQKSSSATPTIPEGGVEANKPYKVSVQFLEIYNEEIRDLLNIHTNPKDVTIRDAAGGMVLVTGAAEVEAPTYTSLMTLFAQGVINRTVGATKMNAVSSRSHAIFTIHLEQRTVDPSSGTKRVTTSKLHLVDLAGSERAKRTGAQGTRFKESVNINQGLLALGNVISALGEIGQKGGDVGAARHVPYRDSKLTRMLQDSLGGNSQTVMIACVTSADASVVESVNTLKYAQRARMIRNRPIRIEALLSSMASDEYSAKMKQLMHFLEHWDQMSSAPDLHEFGDEVLWAMMVRLKKLTEKKRAAAAKAVVVNPDDLVAAAVASVARTPAGAALRPSPSPRAPLPTPMCDVAVEVDFPSPARIITIGVPAGDASTGLTGVDEAGRLPLPMVGESLNFGSPDLTHRVIDASAIGQLFGSFEDMLRSSQLSPRAADRLRGMMDRCMDIIGSNGSAYNSLTGSGSLQASLEFPQAQFQVFASSMNPLYGARSEMSRENGRRLTLTLDEGERDEIADAGEVHLEEGGASERAWADGGEGAASRTPVRYRGETPYSDVSGVSPLSPDSRFPNKGQLAQMDVDELDRLVELEQADAEVMEAQFRAADAKRRQGALQSRLEAEKAERERLRMEAEEAERIALEEAQREAEEAIARQALLEDARRRGSVAGAADAPKGTYAALRARMAAAAAANKAIQSMRQQAAEAHAAGGPSTADGQRSGSAGGGGYSRALSKRGPAAPSAALPMATAMAGLEDTEAARDRELELASSPPMRSTKNFDDTPLEVSPGKTPVGLTPPYSGPGPFSLKTGAPLLAVLVGEHPSGMDDGAPSSASPAHTPSRTLVRTISGSRKFPSPLRDGDSGSRRASRGLVTTSALEELRARLGEQADGAGDEESSNSDTLQSAASTSSQVMQKFNTGMLSRDISERSLMKHAPIQHAGSEKFARAIAHAHLLEQHRRTVSHSSQAGSLARQMSNTETITPQLTPRDSIIEEEEEEEYEGRGNNPSFTGETAARVMSSTGQPAVTPLLVPYPSLALGLSPIPDPSMGSEAYEDEDEDTESETEVARYGSGAAAALRAQIAALESNSASVTPPRPVFSPLPATTPQTQMASQKDAHANRDYLGLDSAAALSPSPSTRAASSYAASVAAAAAAGGSYAAKLAALKTQRQVQQQQILLKTTSSSSDRAAKGASTPGGTPLPPPPAKFVETPRGGPATSPAPAAVPATASTAKYLKVATLPVRSPTGSTPTPLGVPSSPSTLTGLRRLLSPHRALPEGFHEPSLSELPYALVQQQARKSNKASRQPSAAAVQSPPTGASPGAAKPASSAAQGPAPDLGAAAAEMARRSAEASSTAAAARQPSQPPGAPAALRPPQLKLDLLTTNAAPAPASTGGEMEPTRLTTMLSARSRARKDLEEMVRDTEAQFGQLSSKPSTRNASSGRFPSTERPPRSGTANGTGAPGPFQQERAGERLGVAPPAAATFPPAATPSPGRETREKEDSWALFDDYLSSAEKAQGRPSKAWAAPLSIGNGTVQPSSKRSPVPLVGAASPSRKLYATGASGGAAPRVSAAAVTAPAPAAAAAAAAQAGTGVSSARPKSVQRTVSGKGTAPTSAASSRPLSRTGSANGRGAQIARAGSNAATAVPPGERADDGWVPTRKPAPVDPKAVATNRVHDVAQSLGGISHETF